MKHQNRTFADEGTTEEAAQARTTARSPRAACGSAWCWPRSASKNTIQVTEEEVRAPSSSGRASSPARSSRSGSSTARTRRRSPSLRAPIFEDKVVDYLLELAKVTEKKVSQEDLLQDEDEAEEAAGLTPGAAAPARQAGSALRVAGPFILARFRCAAGRKPHEPSGRSRLPPAGGLARLALWTPRGHLDRDVPAACPQTPGACHDSANRCTKRGAPKSTAYSARLP